MAFSHILYQLLIGPLELIFEVVYGFAKNMTGNSGLSIIMLSLALNILLLPLYKRADAIQAEERDTEQRLSRWVDHIKKTFHGDERSMMLQTYYKQNGYKPFYALKGTMPLLLEVPFFIAAYRFLSNLQELKGMPFGPIGDLGIPDTLLTIGGVTIHVLPVAMTIINFISSAIYTKGFRLKDKVQLYGMALLFLVLLYESPAGLVFYWTLNNLFSLIKNLFYKIPQPQKVLRILLSVLGAAMLVYGVGFYKTENIKHRLLIVVLALVLELPLILSLVKGRFGTAKLELPTGGNTKIFVSGCIFLAVLTGMLIPSSVIKSSPAEFVQVADFYSPLRHVVNASLLAFGLFVIWFGVFYYMAKKQSRWVFDIGIWILSGVAIADYMFFATNMGTLSSQLTYGAEPAFSGREKLINLAVLAAVAVVLAVVFFSKKKLIQSVYIVLIIAVFGMSAANVWSIQSKMPQIRQAVEHSSAGKPRFTFSKTRKNVIVLMMDRAINSYIPYLMQEDPELKRQFEGFTYYPNTISYGAYTNIGAPALFGGYDYTPERMNERSSELLVDKHNEAMKVMPALFDKNGFDVTVCDPTYAGYGWIPDLSIYADYPDIKAYNTELGLFMLDPAGINKLWERNFFCYSIMKVAPLVIQPNLYQCGTYFSANAEDQDAVQAEYDMSNAKGQYYSFMQSFAVLQSLPEMTRTDDKAGDTFLMMSNSATHEPMLLSEPDYLPAPVVDNTEFDSTHMDRFVLGGRTMRMENVNQMKHYHVNMACMKQLGKWFDCLRENGVYDNTRIIIAADHGRALGQFDDMKFGKADYEDVMYFNPLLLMKDFGSKGFTTDNSFMTNADVPGLALGGLVTAPVNPFTGRPINGGYKQGEQRILFSLKWDTAENNGYKFLPGTWFSVHDDIFNMNNWKNLGEY